MSTPAAVRALPLWTRAPPVWPMCAVNDLRVVALPFWMVLHPSRQLVHARERLRKVVRSAPALATRAADIIESI